MPKWNALVYLLRCSVIFTALLHNIISKTSRTFRAYHADRRCCVSVLIMSENLVKKRRSSIWKSKKSKQRKHWIKKPCAHEKTVNHWRMSQTLSGYWFHLNRTKLSHSSTWTEYLVEIFGRSKIRPVPIERSPNIRMLLKVNRKSRKQLQQKESSHLPNTWQRAWNKNKKK